MSEHRTPTEGARLFDVPAGTVLEGVACTYCGVGPGLQCVEWKWHALHEQEIPHAQRWRDYWNATTDEHVDAFPAAWLARFIA